MDTHRCCNKSQQKRRTKFDLNYITQSQINAICAETKDCLHTMHGECIGTEFDNVKVETKKNTSTEHTQSKNLKRRQNFIKIRLADEPKDIVIKFQDKETLIKLLREIISG